MLLKKTIFSESIIETPQPNPLWIAQLLTILHKVAAVSNLIADLEESHLKSEMKLRDKREKNFLPDDTPENILKKVKRDR